MAKPSIFSKRYSSRMKRRRLVISSVLILALFGITFIGFEIFVKGNMISDIKNSLILMTTSKEEDTKENPSEKNLSQDNSSEDQANINDKVEEIKKDINLNANEKISVILNSDDNTIKDIQLDENIYSKDISISKQGAIAFNKKTQTIYYIDKDLNVKDVTYKVYTTTKGTKITKESMVPSNPNFVWAAQPRFVSDNLIAYVSQVPWFKSTLYLWTYNLADNTHKPFLNVSGEAIEFKNVDEKGLVVTSGGNNYIVTPSNAVTK